MGSALLILFSCNSTPYESKDVLITADKAFSDYADMHGYGKAFLNFADSSAVMLRDNQMPAKGYEELQSIFDTNDTSVKLTWEPLFADIAQSGELGYTYGIYTVKSPLKSDSAISQGTYVSVWKKNQQNEWKWILDCGTQGLPAK